MVRCDRRSEYMSAWYYCCRGIAMGPWPTHAIFVKLVAELCQAFIGRMSKSTPEVNGRAMKAKSVVGVITQ